MWFVRFWLRNCSVSLEYFFNSERKFFIKVEISYELEILNCYCQTHSRGWSFALLCRNGTGKTSTLRTIARTDLPSLKYGEIWLDHHPIHEMTSYQAAQKGVQLVPEDRRIIGGLSVEGNLKLAQIEEPHGWSFERIYESFPRLAERRKQEAVTLSGGEQHMLAVARALARDL